MKTLHTDVAVVGAGTAGMAAFRAARAHTSRVLLVERGPYGTTCARVGCMPSKLLLAAAEAAHAVRQAPLFGVQAQGLRVDGAAVMARVRSERDRFAGGVVDAVLGWPAEQRLLGHARFVGPNTLQVDGEGGPLRVRAGRIVLATGSRPAVPAAWRQALGDRLLVSDDVFDWPTLPRAVAVVGTGAIGLELAQALHRLGVRVRLYGRQEGQPDGRQDGHQVRLGPLTDPELQALAAQQFAQALPLQWSVGELDLRREGDTVQVACTGAGGLRHTERFDWLLAATGRTPNLDDLGLAHSGLACGDDGVPLHDALTRQCGQRPVFIAGDADHERPLLHEAADEGRSAGDNAGRWPELRAHPRRAPLAVVFSDPQIALAGASHAALVATGQPFATGRVSFADQGRSRVMGRNAGALHLYGCPRSGRLLGAEMLGPAAEHLGHLLAWSVQRGDTVQQMLDSPFYHPVVEEGVRTALRALRRALHMGPAPVPQCLDCGPGA